MSGRERFLGARRAAVLALALLCASLAARSLTLSRERGFPIYDEIVYLRMARDFRELGGTLGAVRSYLRAEYRDDDGKHPLYPLLLAPLMDGSETDYARAKLVSLACALLLAGSVYALSRRLWGDDAALLSCALICLAPSTAYLSREALGDVLFACLYCAALLVLAGAGRGARSWAVFGALCGLAYLAKGDGHLLFASAGAVGLAVFGRRVLSGPQLYAALAAFAASAGFLLVRNVRAWGDPFYNFNAKSLWIDDLAFPRLWLGTPRWDQLGAALYLREHGWGRIIRRFGAGLVGFPFRLAQTIGSGPEDEPWRTCAGACLLGLALWGARCRWRAGKKQEALAVLTTGAALCLVFVWLFEVDHGVMRYVFPVAASLLPLAAVGALDLARRRFRERTTPLLRAAVAAAAIAVLAGSPRGLAGDPMTYRGVSAHWRETSAWIKGRVAPQRVMLDSRSLYSSWDAGLDLNRATLFDRPGPELSAFAARRGLRYALLDRHANARDPFRDKYGALDEQGPASFIGWGRCFHDSQTPSVFLIYSPGCPVPKREGAKK
ncbi:MAG: glycosyltransferase family 39 protein [Elusimicrobia bacterium]|nr:glycosyltransferase family 39 protein [Elusimicrobiota bacterium]